MPPSQAPLGIVVFCAGISTMAVEMLAARLIAPFYGTSLLIWTLLLFSILVALTIGYWWGGKRADQNPTVEPLAKTLLLASGLLTLSPFIGLWWLQSCGRMDFIVARTFGAIVSHVFGLVGAVVLMCVPVALLGSVGPYVIRLRAKDPALMGTGAGSILGLSTIGSIFGTYLPALVGIPFLGTIKSFLALAMMIGFAAAVISPKGNLRIAIVLLGVIFPAGMTEWRVGLLRPGSDVVYENESVYNTVQIKESEVPEGNGHPKYKRVMLILNEGYAVHSITNKSVDEKKKSEDDVWCYPLVGSVWDYMGTLPVLSQPDGRTLDVAIVGLAGGTVARELLAFFKGIFEVKIEGAEIDPMIIKVARSYFDLPEEVDARPQDGRAFLARSNKTYDLIVTDAYRQPYIPFHLTTREYFSLVRSRLKPRGICSINVGSTSPKEALLAKILATMRSVFAEVYIFEVPRVTPLFANFLVVASREKGVIKSPLDPARKEIASKVADRWPKAPVREVLQIWAQNLKPSEESDAIVLTDDRADVENLVHSMIFNAITDPGLNISELDH